MKNKIFLSLLIILFSFTALRGYLPAVEENKTDDATLRPSRAQSITMNFKDIDIRAFIKFISELTAKNFLIDPSVKGTVTVLSPEKVTIDEAYRVFLSVLEVNGYTTVPAGKVIKIIPSGDAKSKGLETIRGKVGISKEDKIITQLIPLKYASADHMVKILRPLVSKAGLLVADPETHTIILIDTQSNISRLLYIIKELDIPGNEEINVFFLEYASAEDLASKLLNVLQESKGKQQPAQALKIIPDKRTNSLITLSTPYNTMNIKMLLAKLDQKQSRPLSNIHIFYLQNAVAEDLSKVIREIPGKGTPGQKGKAPVISKEVQISADASTNSLVIIAEPDEYEILKGVIQKLDIPRKMVYVEALIMEVTASKSLDLGVEWRFGNTYDGGYGEGRKGGFWFGGSSGDTANIAGLAGGGVPTGLVAGVIGRAITLGDTTFPSIGAFIRFASADSDYNIISTPQILTLNNEEASIEVGQNIPFATRAEKDAPTEATLLQQYEYKDVGVSLKVTPRINDEGIVRLEIEQSVKSVLESTALGGTVLAPTTTFRTAQTNITMRDEETAVIAGLMQNRIDKSTTRAPLLGRIPLLGWLFKSKSDRDEKTNLFVFLTPHIIENPMEAQALRERKQREMDEATKDQKKSKKKKRKKEENEQSREWEDSIQWGTWWWMGS
jgi:general secretion pathway protein D